MDNPVDNSAEPNPAQPDPDRAVRLRFGPDRRYTVGAAVGTVVFGLGALAADDAPGRLLFALAALLLLAYLGTDLIFAPRLVLASDGITVNAPTARVRCAWSAVERFELDSRLRRGLRTTTVEIDAGDQLIVLTRRALGADPEQVVELARSFQKVSDR